MPGYEMVPATQDHLYRPKPQFWSFDNRDPILQVGPFFVSFQVFTTGDNENSYGVARDHVRVEQSGRHWTVKATSFASAGQQVLYAGTLEATFTLEQDGSFLTTITASADEPLRAVKLRLHQLPAAHVFQTGWNVDPNGLPVTSDGSNFVYPEYQGGMPAWQLAFANSGLGVISTDVKPRPKRFTAYLQGQEVVIDLVHEEDARYFAKTISVPAWELHPGASLEAVISRREHILEQQACLVRWEQRTDVPLWARDVRLVVTLHGMHWSGFIFNDYAQMQMIVQWVCKRIPGSFVVFHIAGWEGRYYRRYGDSRADERMGGAPGLHALVAAAHANGSHVLPFYSGNYPQPGTPHYEEYGPASHFDASTGLRWDPMRGYVVDWGQLRGSGMTGGGPSLNPGAPLWRDFLTNQILTLNDQFQFDGAYFDTQPSSENDRHYNALEGFRFITDQIRSHTPNMLIATESWFDLSLPFVAWSQTPDGPGLWTRKYQRRFAHLSMGEPSRGSTGVHELGSVPYRRDDLDRMFDIPTLSFVDGTLDHAKTELEAVIRKARRTSI